MAGPLEGIRVVDMGHAGVGPYAGSIMGQLGADVIKIEPPWGDIIQQSGGRGIEDEKRDMSTFYIGCNLSKRGVIFNLKEEKDREIYYKLIETADVYMDNWRADAASHTGIDYASLSKINPRIVYVNSSGFGARGPWSKMGSYDGYGEMFSGITSFTGDIGTRGEKARGGVRIDTQTSLCLVEMIMSGLYYRQITGKGQFIQGSQMESAVQLATVRFAELNFGLTPKPMGSGHPFMVPSRAYRTKDDAWIAVTAHNERDWRNLCLALGRSDLIFDVRFHNNAARVEHRDALDAALDGVFATRTAEEWFEGLQARKVPSGTKVTHMQHITDPHIMGQDMLRPMSTYWRDMILPTLPIRFSETPRETRAGPRPGEHTKEILAELGFPPERASEWVGPNQRVATAQAGR
ncbi:MAG: CoA transferase [Dehalococcoidia bacterium]|nr:CoA transferase [Dehalococcoidia bacterium]